MNIKKSISVLLLFGTLIAQAALPSAVYASGTVGNGTPGSCTEGAFTTALAGGGTVTFNCGGPVTITLTSTKTIASDTQINGNGVITLSGGNTVRLFTVNSPATLNLSNITITLGSVSGDNGGALLINSGATVNISNSTFSNSHTFNGYGGAIYVGGAASVTTALNITDSTFSGNYADVEGLGDTALGGGAIQNNDGTVTISGSTFSGNSVRSHSADGGAIYNGDLDGPSFTPDDNPDTLTITNSTFYNNRLLNSSALPESGDSGGAIRSASILSITHSTFSDNDSGITEDQGEAGAVTLSYGTVTLIDNIFANSTAADCAKRNTVTSLTSEGNLIETNHTGVSGCGTPAVTGDPVLGPLQNNGGPTKTMALGLGSPAVDALNVCGDSITIDQRGIARPQGAKCDIGAYELDATSPAITNVTSTAANATYGVGSTIPITVTFSENVSVTGTPQLTLETGATDRTAAYSSGSGTSTLTFNYTVQAGDISSDLDYASTSALALNGGTIQDPALNNADLLLPAPGTAGSLGANKSIVIEAVAPTVNTFTATSPVSSLNIPISAFTASDNIGVTGYLVTESSTQPSAGDAGWTGTAPTSYAVGADGNYTLYPWAKDSIGNVSPVFGTPAHVIVDRTAPDTTILTKPSNPTKSSAAVFTFSGNDGSGSGVASFECQLDGGGYQPCTSGTDFGPVTPASHTFDVRATDNLGHTDASPASYAWSVDVTVPSIVSVTRADADNTLASTVNFTVTFSEPVKNVGAADFALTTTGVSGAAVTNVSGTGATYTVTVNTGTNNGTIRLDIPASASIQDLADNALSGLPFTGGQVYTIVKTSFVDVPASYWAWNFIERLYRARITGGCLSSPLSYCPEATLTRAQMAVFLLKSKYGPSYAPPAVGSSTGFTDVSTGHWAAAWIKELAVEGITGGCGPGIYCPEAVVTRDQMAVFLLKSKYGPSYTPPAVGASTGFVDVPPDYWAAAWIKQLVLEGITSGCGNGKYCPAGSSGQVSRAQMAVFLVRTFNLP